MTGALLGFQARTLSLTVDEPVHLLSAYLYWNGRDRLEPGDFPPLVKLAGGWAIRNSTLSVAPDLGYPGDTRKEWPEAAGMIARSSHKALADATFRARLPLIVFPLATMFLLWRWGRALFSPATGLTLAALFALEPTALGHGALFKNDHAAAFTYLLFWYTAWSQWNRPWPRFAALLGLAAGLGAVSKLSLLVLIPVAIVLVTFQSRRIRTAIPAAALALAASYAIIVTIYLFDVRQLAESDLAALDRTSAPVAVKTAARVFQFVPVANNMWRGVMTLSVDASLPKYIHVLGTLREGGHWLYFGLAAAVKGAAGILILFVAGLMLMWGFGLRALWCVGPMLLYAVLATLSGFQLGLRLILPCLPFAILVCGIAIHQASLTGLRYLTAACLLLLSAESMSAYPHGIGFFNFLAGGTARGPHYLSDSNLGWGGSLATLSAAIERLNWTDVKLFYFGGDTPYRFLKDGRFQFMAPPWAPELAQGERFRPTPGYYAVSAAFLSGQLFSPRYKDYFEVFRQMAPVERAGSIYLYQVPAPSVRKGS